MRAFKILAFSWFLLIGGLVNGQDQSTAYEKKYNGAKLLFSQGNYSLAMEAFKPLIQADDTNPYSSYASFYYALAAYREGYIPMAKNMFLQIKELFPKWSKIDEVNLWLANIYFEEEEYNSALNALKSVDKRQEDYIKNLKKYYLSGIKDIEVLQDLYNNTEDEVAADILAKSIAAKPLAQRDQKLLDELIEKFDMDHEVLDVAHISKTIHKDEYRVAAVLPLMVNDLEPTDQRKVNWFVLDLFEGIRLAVDSLKEAGINIKLYAYDTKRDSTATTRILKRDELKSMDLIIGPVYNKQIELVTEFAYRNQINVINPFYSNDDIIANNPFSFLYKPSSETIGLRTAEYVSELLENKVGVIFYGENKQDSLMASAYKKQMEKDGFEIIINKEIKRDSSRAILDLLLISNRRIKDASSVDAKDDYTIAMDSIGHIFVASNNDLISSKVISAVETRGDSIKVIGSVDWLELPSINYETYGRLGAVLYAPAYLPKDTLDYDKFRQRYVKYLKKSPSNFVANGFELMMFMGKSLDEYGKYFQLGWSKEQLMPGAIGFGYNYKHANANQVVPILSFEGEKRKVILKGEKISDEDREQ